MITQRSIRNLTLAAFALLATGLASTASAASQADGFYLKDGDRVVFYGDSITDQRLYTTFAETFVVTRFPALDVTFTHSGWGGDRVGGGGGGNIDTRLERDVYAYNPTVMTIMLGMNDGSYRAFDQGIFNTYKNGLTSIVGKVQKQLPGIRLTLIQPSPYDDVTREPRFSGGYNNVLVRYGAAVKEIADANNQNVADLNTSVVAMLQKAKATDAKLSEKIINDRVHPGPSGHLIMAAALLKSWNAPATVTDVAIDASAQKITRSENTNAANLKVSADAMNLAWTQLDAALPMPVDMGNAETALAVNSSDFIAELNQQTLRVTGLTADGYDLFIDGKTVGNFTAAQLSQGVNLADLATPMAAQAADVHKLTLQRANLHNIRWRTFQVPYANAAENIRASLPTLMTALDEADAAAARMQRAAAQPLVRRYELKGLSAAQLAAKGAPAEQLPANVGANLALNKKWKSSAANTYGWDKGLTDGVWTGRSPNVYATDDKDTFPKTVTIDLENATTLGHIVIGVPDYGSTKTIAVSVSADGNDFKEVGRYEFSLRNAEKRLFNFEPATARYVRLTYIDYHQTEAGYNRRFAFTTDVQAFAPAK